MAAGGYCLMSFYRQMRMAWKSAYIWFSSWFNAAKYLKPDNIEEMMDMIEPNSGPPTNRNDSFPRRSYAVIYGASTKAGKAYALHLAEKGF